jgi:lysozyme
LQQHHAPSDQRGQIWAACNSLTWFNRAGGRVLRGLVDRRAREQQICLKDAA